MPKPTKHQQIWRRTKNGLRFDMPKTIDSDIGFQLMFGEVEKNWMNVERFEKHCNNYEARIYRDLEDFKRFI